MPNFSCAFGCSNRKLNDNLTFYQIRRTTMPQCAWLHAYQSLKYRKIKAKELNKFYFLQPLTDNATKLTGIYENKNTHRVSF